MSLQGIARLAASSLADMLPGCDPVIALKLCREIRALLKQASEVVEPAKSERMAELARMRHAKGRADTHAYPAGAVREPMRSACVEPCVEPAAEHAEGLREACETACAEPAQTHAAPHASRVRAAVLYSGTLSTDSGTEVQVQKGVQEEIEGSGGKEELRATTAAEAHAGSDAQNDAQRMRASMRVRVPDRPDGVAESVWADWIAHRKRKRAHVTETALAGIRREAEAAGMSLEAALAHSITQGWQGFKAEWVTQNRDGKPKALAPSGLRITHPERMPVPYDSPTGPCFCALCVKARAGRVAQ